MNDIPRNDAEIVKELARGAKSLKEDRAFMAAIALLKRQWGGEILICPNDKLIELRAKLQALDAIPSVLDSLIANEKMLQQRETHGVR